MIEADVARVATHWGLDPALLQAIVTAEGNIVKAVQCSIPSVTARAEALEVTARSVTHRLCAFALATDPAAFVGMLGATWAPVGAANDPRGLNANWVGNVRKLWSANRV